MILVAYDVSFVAPYPAQKSPITGVGRVIEEIFSKLSREDITVKATACHDEDWNPVVTVMKGEEWIQQKGINPDSFLSPIRTDSGLLSWLLRRQLAWEIMLNDKMVSLDAKGITGKNHPIILRLLRKILLRCLKFGYEGNPVNVFLATFLPPPRWLDENLPRVHFVYDVIPLRCLEESGQAAQEMLKAVIKSLVPHRDKVIVNSLYTKQDFCELTSFPEDDVWIAPLAASDNFKPSLSPADSLRVRNIYNLGTSPYFLSVSNPQPRKNLPRLIRAFYKLAEQSSSWQGNLVLAGNPKVGWGLNEIEIAIQQNPNLAHRVLKIGPVEEQDLSVLYSNSIAFVFPSTYEGFGLPVLEAMQCGAPVICSNSTSLPEIVGASALLVNPLEENEITEAMRTLKDNESICNELRVKGLNRAQLFSWDRTADCVATTLRVAVSKVK